MRSIKNDGIKLGVEPLLQLVGNIAMSQLHQFIKGAKTKSSPSHPPIDLYDRITVDQGECKGAWLKDLGKNGYEHSERLEEYLDSFTKDLREKKLLTQEEAFVLLCAVYMHDIGYRDGGNGHGKKSKEMILDEPSTYHFGDFPPYRHSPCPRVAEAVGNTLRRSYPL